MLISVNSAAKASLRLAEDRNAPSPVDRHVLPQPRRVLPPIGSDVAMCDWDTLFDAITQRLGAMGDGGALREAEAGLRECVGAMRQLQASMAHERARNEQLELDLVETRSALLQARVELVGSRADERRSRHLSLHDELTSLPNRSYFGEWLSLTLQKALPLQEQFAVLYLDLDGFKPINDLHGHDVGDEVLRIVAARLARALRAQDMVSRVGGDEFACLLTRVPGREQVGHLACKLLEAVSAPVRVGSHDISVRPSIGVAMCPDHGATGEDLLRHADAAMYHAKRQRSGYAFFDPAAPA